jgi:HPt (histidine-containing phosphotransfer) domain-containing protein
MNTNVTLQERMRLLRQDYVASLPERLAVMRKALAANDRVALQHEAHRLAGTGVSYGAPELSDWGREVEHKCRTGVPLADLQDDVERLAVLLARLQPEPQSWS